MVPYFWPILYICLFKTCFSIYKGPVRLCNQTRTYDYYLLRSAFISIYNFACTFNFTVWRSRIESFYSNFNYIFCWNCRFIISCQHCMFYHKFLSRNHRNFFCRLLSHLYIQLLIQPSIQVSVWFIIASINFTLSISTGFSLKYLEWMVVQKLSLKVPITWKALGLNIISYISLEM